MAVTYSSDILSKIITAQMFPAGMDMREVHPKIKYFEDAKEVGKSLFALQGREISRKAIADPTVYCYEKEPMGEWLQLNGAIVLGDTTITVDAVGPLKPDDLVQIWSADLSDHEQIRVLTVPTSTTFTCTRNYGTSSTGTWADNSKLKIVGNAGKEDGSLPTIINRIPGEEYNYVTIHRTSIGGSIFFVNRKTYTGDPWTDQLIEKWIDHLNVKVNFALYADRKWDTTNGLPVGEGIIPAIIRRGGTLDPIGGVITFKRFLETMRLAFKVGSSKKLGLFCPMMLYALAEWKEQRKIVMNEDQYLNMRVDRLDLPGGYQLMVLPERKLSGDPSDSPDALFGGSFLVIDPSNVTYHPYLNFDEKLLKNRQLPDSLSRKEEYISIFVFRWDVITSHTFAYGIIGYN
jgi:hypothetical protein